jgi:hypothetical protein
VSYKERQAEMEQKALERLQSGQHYFNPYTEASLWMACHRLKNAGVVKELTVSNCFELDTRAKIIAQ